MKIEYWEIEKAIAAFWEDNPKVISEFQLNSLRNSIREYGLILPVVYNKTTDKIVSGHQRIKASQLEGITEIPVVVVEFDEEKSKSLAIALQRIRGEWDYEKLEKCLEVIVDNELVELTGFNENEVLGIIEKGENETGIEFNSPQLNFVVTVEEYNKILDTLEDCYGSNQKYIVEKFFERIGL
jgi:ParB-like chromosome segregation protein Spo0J